MILNDEKDRSSSHLDYRKVQMDNALKAGDAKKAIQDTVVHKLVYVSPKEFFVFTINIYQQDTELVTSCMTKEKRNTK